MLCICYITLNFFKTLSSTSGQISRALLVTAGFGTIQMISERGIHISLSFLDLLNLLRLCESPLCSRKIMCASSPSSSISSTCPMYGLPE